MNIKDQLPQARRERGLSYQQIAKQIQGMTGPQVRAVFETESPDQYAKSKVLKFFGIEEEETRPPLLSLTRGQQLTSKRSKPVTKKIIDDQRKKVQANQNKATLKLAKGQACVNCGIDDGTIVSAHYTGFRQHELGKCLGGKGNHNATAFLCNSACHPAMDQPKERKNVASSKRFLFCIIKTLLIKDEKGGFLIELARQITENIEEVTEEFLFRFLQALIIEIES
jgi:hypothetical protein